MSDEALLLAQILPASHERLVEMLKKAAINHAQTRVFSSDSSETRYVLVLIETELLRRLYLVDNATR